MISVKARNNPGAVRSVICRPPFPLISWNGHQLRGRKEVLIERQGWKRAWLAHVTLHINLLVGTTQLYIGSNGYGLKSEYPKNILLKFNNHCCLTSPTSHKNST